MPRRLFIRISIRSCQQKSNPFYETVRLNMKVLLLLPAE
jgi:hypothetical protein